MTAKDKQRNIKRADPSTIQSKVLVGYQGWFTCAGDGSTTGLPEWQHWFSSRRHGQRPATDLWPDVSEYTPSELFPVPHTKQRSGHPGYLFSSRHPQTVQRHFHFMAQHGVDGAFLHRFLGQVDPFCDNPSGLRLRDEIGKRVCEAAEAEGRVFAVMYDVSGVNPERMQAILERDWTHLVQEEGILDSPNYLYENGKPVIGLFGVGFAERGHSPELLTSLTTFLRDSTDGGVYIVAGVPTHWRTSDGDADSNPDFVDAWLNHVDAISPWTIGRYRNEDQVDQYLEDIVMQDIKYLTRRNETGKWRCLDYIPVVLPGASGYNMSRGRWRYNDIKRDGGHFLWRQIYNACSQGIRTLYMVSWDEFDEGTALMPAVSERRLLPSCARPSKFMALDEDGYDLPSDWYMRICGLAADILHRDWPLRELFPFEPLRAYWASHPRYEIIEREPSSHAEQETVATRAQEISPPPYSPDRRSVALPLNPAELMAASATFQESEEKEASTSSSSRPLPQVPSPPLRVRNPSPSRESSLSEEDSKRRLSEQILIGPYIPPHRRSQSSSSLRRNMPVQPDADATVPEGRSSRSMSSSFVTLNDSFVFPVIESSTSSVGSLPPDTSKAPSRPISGRLSRFLPFAREDEEDKEDRRLKKEEMKARRERLAYDLKMKGKADPSRDRPVVIL